MENIRDFDVLFDTHMEQFLPPEARTQFELLQSAAASTESSEASRISGSARTALLDLFDRKVLDRFRNEQERERKRQERNRKRLEMRIAELRQTGTQSEGSLFPRLERIKATVADIQSILEENGTEVPTDLFLAMDGVLEKHFREHQPWWHKTAGQDIAELRGLIVQYENAVRSGSDNHALLAADLTRRFDETVGYFIKFSHLDVNN